MFHLAILFLLYFLPTIIAANRGHHVAGILLLNFFLPGPESAGSSCFSGRCSPHRRITTTRTTATGADTSAGKVTLPLALTPLARNP